MAMNCTGVLYFPITISVLEGIALELIEARFGLKGWRHLLPILVIGEIETFADEVDILRNCLCI